MTSGTSQRLITKMEPAESSVNMMLYSLWEVKYWIYLDGYFTFYFNKVKCIAKTGSHSNLVGSGTMLQAIKSLVPFPMSHRIFELP
jgi:hypothetical protein